jgi:mono/diheme cytochrome c family protein
MKKMWLKPNSAMPILGILIALSLAVAGCGGGSEAATKTTAPANTAGLTGVELYKNNCARCHADDRTGSVLGRSITSTNDTIANSTADQLATLIQFHRASLHLTPEQLTALANFLKSP